MSLFDSFVDIIGAPVRCADELVKDLSGDNTNEEADTMLSLMTLGGSSLVKGISKSIEKAAEDLDE